MPDVDEHGPVIAVMAEEERIDIGFPMVAAYHGQAALAMAAVTFQAMRAAFAALSPGRPPARRDITIVSGHPGPGVRDSFEAVTRALTRGAYTVDRSLPEARLVPGHDISYSFRITLGAHTAQVALRPGALPERFFALNFGGARSPEQERELSLLKRAIAAQVLGASFDDLFTLHVH